MDYIARRSMRLRHHLPSRLAAISYKILFGSSERVGTALRARVQSRSRECRSRAKATRSQALKATGQEFAYPREDQGHTSPTRQF